MIIDNLKLIVLMGLLTGLLYATFLIFHIHPLLAIIFALIPNLFAYFFSDKIVLSSYGARIVDESEAPQLHRMVEKIAMKANIPKPKVAIVETPTPNAFATGRDPNHAVVAVTTGILNLLTPEELEGVLSHEVAHIIHRDILISTIVAVMAGAVVYVAEFAKWGFIFGGHDDEGNPMDFIASILFIIFAPIAAMLIQFAISRQREFYADEDGAKLSNPIYLANALAKLERGVEAYPMEKGNPATAHMFIVNPFRSDFIAKLFSTHPPTEERIERLLEMAKKLGYMY